MEEIHHKKKKKVLLGLCNEYQCQQVSPHSVGASEWSRSAFPINAYSSHSNRFQNMS